MDEFGQHQMRDFREHDATSAPAELGGEIQCSVSRNRTRAQVPPQARKSHAHGSGTLGAFWRVERRSRIRRLIISNHNNSNINNNNSNNNNNDHNNNNTTTTTTTTATTDNNTYYHHYYYHE